MLYKNIEKIRSRADFIRFLRLLAKDFRQNPGEWANRTVPDFLEQAAAWSEDFPGCPADDMERGAWERGDYRLFARILYMGKLYE